MNRPENTPQNRHPGSAQAGGFFIFAGLMAGVVIGLIYDEPSMGMVGGLAAGIAVAVVVWLLDRRKG